MIDRCVNHKLSRVQQTDDSVGQTFGRARQTLRFRWLASSGGRSRTNLCSRNSNYQVSTLRDKNNQSFRRETNTKKLRMPIGPKGVYLARRIMNNELLAGFQLQLVVAFIDKNQ